MAATSCAHGEGAGRGEHHGSDGRFEVVATGDIACGQSAGTAEPGDMCRYDLVGQLVMSLAPDRFLALGDIQYPISSTPDYGFYDAVFGGLKGITSPTPGDADWSPDPGPYRAYFGRAAGSPGGYYSFDIGTWHVIALNSRDCWDKDGCGTTSKQYEWLRADLTAHPNDLYPCTLAFFHDPRFLWVDWWQRDGAPKGPDPRVTPFWGLLYGAGADVVLGGSAHNYERWGPQDPGGTVDLERGITEFVVGTGGRRLLGFGPKPRPSNLAAAQDQAFGALQMQLDTGNLGYAWHSAPGQPAFQDEGTVTCH